VFCLLNDTWESNQRWQIHLFPIDKTKLSNFIFFVDGVVLSFVRVFVLEQNVFLQTFYNGGFELTGLSVSA